MALKFNDGNEREKKRPIGLSYTMAVKIVSCTSAETGNMKFHLFSLLK